MTVDHDKQDDWVTSQLKATCNVHSSAFIDWWSGHLNFQIEHQLVFTKLPHVSQSFKTLFQQILNAS